MTERVPHLWKVSYSERLHSVDGTYQEDRQSNKDASLHWSEEDARAAGDAAERDYRITDCGDVNPPSHKEPIVWTSIGNINERFCEVFIEWQKNENEIVFVKHWHYQGVEVKREPHVFKLKGIESVAENVPST